MALIFTRLGTTPFSIWLLMRRWVWAGLGPEGIQTAPDHDIQQQPCLHWRIVFDGLPNEQVIIPPACTALHMMRKLS